MKSKEKAFTQTKKEISIAHSGQQKNVFRNITSLHPYFFFSISFILFFSSLSLPTIQLLLYLHLSLSYLHPFYLTTYIGNTFDPQLKTQHSDWLKGEPTFIKDFAPSFLLIYYLGEHHHFSLGSLLWFPKREKTCMCMEVTCTLMGMNHTCTTGNSGGF